MEKIFKRLDFAISISEQITSHFDKKDIEEVSMFCMCILDRLNFSSEGLKLLLNKFTTNTKVEYSSGIIIRACLLDYLIVLNAMEVYGKNSGHPQKIYLELKKYCLMMLCDSVRNTMTYFDSLENQIPKSTLENMYNSLVAMNEKCFESYKYDGSRPEIKIKASKSPKSLFNTLMTSKDLKGYQSVYEAYLFYSKYDHFGHMSYSLSRIKPLEQLARIDKAIATFSRVLLFTTIILETLYGSDSFLKIKREEIEAFINASEK